MLDIVMKFAIGTNLLLLCLLFAPLPAFGQGSNPWIEQANGVPNFLTTVTKKQKAHVAFLGGSITQKADGHSAMVADRLQQAYPDCEFTFTNAGLSSTCSTTGAFRLSDHVLAKGPIDLLIVEFAVNDDQDAGHDRAHAIRGLEGIIRAFKQANPTGDIISVQYVNPHILEQFQNSKVATSVQAHKDVARHYQTPIVDVGLALANAISTGETSWKQYGGTHPKKAGYQFATKLIFSVIEKSASNSSDATPTPLPKPLDSFSYQNGKFLDPQIATTQGKWKIDIVSRDLLPMGAIRSDYEKYQLLRSDQPGDQLEINFQGNMLGAFVLAGPDAGKLEVSVNEGDWQTVDLYHERYSKGLNYPRSVILAEELTTADNKAIIRIAAESNPLSKGHAASILFFEVNEK